MSKIVWLKVFANVVKHSESKFGMFGDVARYETGTKTITVKGLHFRRRSYSFAAKEIPKLG